MSKILSTEITVEKLAEAIKEAKEKSKKRNFTQSIELIIAIEGLDLKKPENRIRTTIKLPYPPKKKKLIAVFADGVMAEKAKEAGVDHVFSEKDLSGLSGLKREIRKIAKKFDFFLAEPKLMALVGKIMGFVLGPRGKMPQIITPATDIKKLVDELRSSVFVNVRNNPMVGVSIGTEDIDDDKLAENALTVIKNIESKLPEKAYIKRIYVKTTMGPSVRVI